jgi:hypothetical protein
VKGPIPDAPGLEDLDEIHPESDIMKIEVEEDEGPFSLTVLPPVAVFSDITVSETSAKPKTKKKSSKGKRLGIVFVVFTALGAAGWYVWKNNLLPL